MEKKLETFLFKSVSYNMTLQMSFRIFSFILNAILFRNVSNELIGACNFRLALLYTTIMFLAKEPFRRSLPKLAEVENKWTHFINSLWLIIPSGLFVSLICGVLWSQVFDQPDQQLVSNFKYSIYLLCISCIIELIGEIPNCVSQLYFMAKMKVLIEASSLFIFNITFVILAIFCPSLGALAYSLARLLNSFIFMSSNFYFLIKKNNKQLAELLPSKPYLEFDMSYLLLVKAYYTQSLFKQLLTEGERYLITVFNLLSYSESGIYDIINNLGSLIARFIFLPIEDGSYIFFTNSLKRGTVFKQQGNQENSLKAKNYFEFALKLVSLIGLLVFVFGQSYAQLFLQLYGGDKLGGSSVSVNMLRFHCLYIYFLGVNGITESFFNATMSEYQLKEHNYRLILFSVVFLAFTFGSVKVFSVYGFLIANCLNMLVRIVYSSGYINTFFNGYKYDEVDESSLSYGIHKGIFPGFNLSLTLLVSLLVTKLSEFYLFRFQIGHFLIGSVLFLLNLLVIYFNERSFIFYALSIVKNKKN